MDPAPVPAPMPAIDDLLILVPVLLTSGVAAGVIAGLLGVGGGLVVVPILLQTYRLLGAELGIDPAVQVHTAIGTSLATIVPTAISSSRAHWRREAVDLAVLRAWGPWIVVGVVLGAIVGSRSAGWQLMIVFGVVAYAAAANLAFGRDGHALRDGLPRPPWRQGIPVAIGLVSTVMGIGGGTMAVPSLTLCGWPVRRAVGTASAVGLVIALPGAIGFAVAGWGLPGRPPLAVGFVDLLAFALIIPMTMLMAPVGARIAHNIPGRWLRRAFAVFLVIVGTRMVWGAAATAMASG